MMAAVGTVEHEITAGEVQAAFRRDAYALVPELRAAFGFNVRGRAGSELRAGARFIAGHVPGRVMPDGEELPGKWYGAAVSADGRTVIGYEKAAQSVERTGRGYGANDVLLAGPILVLGPNSAGASDAEILYTVAVECWFESARRA